MAKQTIFGSGLSFPPRIGGDGRLAWASEQDGVRESIEIILRTEPGERVMREEFGCGLRRHLAEPNTPTTRQLIRQRVTAAIRRWEPRATVQQVTVEQDADDPSVAHLIVVYELNATRSLQTLNLTLETGV
jgi:phage baseplate assembly protein W